MIFKLFLIRDGVTKYKFSPSAPYFKFVEVSIVNIKGVINSLKVEEAMVTNGEYSFIPGNNFYIGSGANELQT